MPSNADGGVDVPSWLRSSRCRLFIDTQFPDWTRPGQSGGSVQGLHGVATKLDPADIVEAACSVGADAIVGFAKCQYGNFYYDTELGHKHAGLGARDHLGDLVRLGHAAGLRVMGYFSNRWDVEAARAHPDWMAVGADGGRSYERWPTLCLLSPYRELAARQLRELVGRYEVDGVWSDILHGSPCYCSRCEADFGGDLPRVPGDPGWLDLLRWHRRVVADYIDETRRAVKDTRPDTAFVINHYASVYVDARMGLGAEHLEASDGTSTEGYAEWHGLLYPGFAAEFLAAAAPGRPSEVLVSRFASTWDYSLKPLAQMRFEAFSAAVRGAAISFDDEPYHDGTLEPEVYRRIADVFGEMRARARWLDLDSYVADAAIYVSQTSRDLATLLDGARPWGARQFPPLELNEGPSDLVPATMGMYKALLESQLTVAVATGPIPLPSDGGPRVLCLPGVLALDDTEETWIKAYVAGGGGLVCTGQTSRFETDGTPRSSLRLAELLGMDLAADAPVDPYTYVQPAAGGGIAESRPYPQYLSTLALQAISTDVDVIADRRRPIIDGGPERYFHNNQPAPWGPAAGPAIVRRRYGRGRVVVMAGSPDGNVARLGSEDHARSLVDAVRWAAGSDPLVRVEGPSGMRVVVGWKGLDLVVHLVTAVPDFAVRHGSDRTLETISRVTPVCDVRLRIATLATAAVREPQGESLELSRDGDVSVIDLGHVSDWETIRIVPAHPHRESP